MYVFKRKTNIDDIVNEATLRSEYSPTIFKIYDKSTETVCNRLIIVEPFDWYVWACRGELYILNPEGGIKCAANSTPAIQVLSDQFLETCLKLNLNSILDVYVNGKIPHIVSYEITTTTFTILSALNILMKDLITFNIDNNTSNIVKNGGIFTKMTHLTDEDLLNDNANDDSVNIKPLENIKTYRLLSESDVIKITNHKNRNVSDLSTHYTRHTSKLRPKYDNADNFRSHELDKSHGSYITLRQHAVDAHETHPRMLLSQPKIIEI